MLEPLYAFCAVVEQQSLAKAAKKLGISTPMMTRRIQQLEHSLKAKLLHRSTRGVRLTEAGQAFYQQALETIAHYEAGSKAVHSLSDTVSGTLKIGLPVSLSHLWLTPALHTFCQQYPDVKIHIVNGNHLLDLLKEGFDLVIHCGDLPDSSFYSRKIRDWYKFTCAAPAYIEHHGAPKHPNELEHYHCLNHYDTRHNTWPYRINNQRHNIYINAAIKVNSSIDLVNLAVSGLGLVNLPDFCVQQEIDTGKLVTLLDDFRPIPLGMYAIYPSKEYLSRKTSAMLDFLLDTLQL